ncbi:hypothetical protein KQX54_005893 [Cotesia glomerata]|uniref:Uncharacterized protein n=1 Tax=Cotesia glomerata TaxID=32391 RepID=A0AAV7IPQ6_COTGL|nr:hypothetical protein KQX54_005893 [Cotesia glomerata]
MAKILLMFIVLTCLIATITPAVHDYSCYSSGCSKVKGRCTKDGGYCDGYTCHTYAFVEGTGCYPSNPRPCSESKNNTV